VWIRIPQPKKSGPNGDNAATAAEVQSFSNGPVSVSDWTDIFIITLERGTIWMIASGPKLFPKLPDWATPEGWP